jgi:prevent-host-death family protein
MKIIPVAEAKNKLSEYIERSSEEAVIITKNGKPCAILIGVTEEDDLEHYVISYNKRLREILAQSIQSAKEKGVLSHEEVWARVKEQSGGKKKASRTASEKPARRRAG